MADLKPDWILLSKLFFFLSIQSSPLTLITVLLSSLSQKPPIGKEFSSDVDSAVAALRTIKVASSALLASSSSLVPGHADLTQLFRVANHEAKKSRALNRILRVVLLYCRSSTPLHHQWTSSQKLFTFDVIYLHDKPTVDNCPQMVYDSLVDALEQVSDHEGYIFESGQGLTRVLFRHMCILLCHPQQRCVQDDIDLPKDLHKKSSSGLSETQSLT